MLAKFRLIVKPEEDKEKPDGDAKDVTGGVTSHPQTAELVIDGDKEIVEQVLDRIKWYYRKAEIS